MKIKTAELTGAALDWAVAKSSGQQGRMAALEAGVRFWSPSSDWADGGPIIERERIATSFCQAPNTLGGDCWIATYPAWPVRENTVWAEGPTPLIAAMRCFVATKFGDEVDVPDELP